MGPSERWLYRVIKMKSKYFFGFTLVIIGVVTILTSATGITGFAISNNFKDEINFIFGVIPLIAGLLLLLFGRGDEDSYSGKGKDRMKSNDGLRKHNREGRRGAEQMYFEQHGERPGANSEEFKTFKRVVHEDGSLDRYLNDN